MLNALQAHSLRRQSEPPAVSVQPKFARRHGTDIAIALLRSHVKLLYLASLWLSADVAELADALDSKFHFSPFFPVSSHFTKSHKCIAFIG
jgi:hypothetical protein